MTEIVPAILAKDFNDLREKISRIGSVAKTVQIDICDGKFVSSISWPMQERDKQSISAIIDEEEGLPYWDSLDFEFDLMVKNAHKQFEFFTRLGAKKIIFHIEAEDENDFKEFLEGLDMYIKENIQIGLAINTTTNIDKLSPFINLIDFVQCMGIEHVGFQGEPFDERVLDQISSLRTKYPELIISIDGGVNMKTAPLLVKAGANRLVVGSLLMGNYDVYETIKELENL
jgi:ribulose-phosphate 3-epimerase